MSQIQTESVNLSVVAETTLGANPPPNSGWSNLEPNTISKIAATYKKLPRDPISKAQQLQKGMLVDEDSGVEVEFDVTMWHVDTFAQGVFRSATKHSGGTGTSGFSPSAVSAGSPGHFTVAAGGALQAGTLIFARDFLNSANNGLLDVASGSTNTQINVASLVAEASPPAKARVDVAGFRGATGDLQLDSSGNLTSTVADFTTMGLNEGQWIYVGDGATHSFATATYTGSARIAKGGIAAHKLTFERRAWTVGAADTGTGVALDIYFSRFWRNVSLDNADYQKPSYAFEIWYPGLGSPTDEFEYPLGNMIDEWTWNFPLTTKATVSAKFVGTKTPNISTTRNTGPSTAVDPSTKTGISTAQDLARLQIANVDETGVSTDFESLKITVKNNVSPQKELGTLGATLLNVGKHEVMIEADLIFTNDQPILAVRDNRDMTLAMLMRNGDFGALLDVQSFTLDSTDRKLEKNKSVKLTSKGTGHQNDVTGSTDSLSLFAFVPNPST